MNQIKPGDEFTMRCTVTHIDESGRVWFTRPHGRIASNITTDNMADAIVSGEIKFEQSAKLD